MQTYFSLDENFDKIIQSSLPDESIVSINPISTGWTNIVFEVNTNKNDYFFRFPRDDFWIRTIVKDCEFSNFINNKTKFNTVLLKEMKHNGRPFSIHKKIEGKPLAEKISTLSPEELEIISKEIAEFMYELHSVQFDKDNIFKTNNIGLNLVDFLDELIQMHLSSKDKEFWDYSKFIQKNHSCLVHGDFNLSNVLLDENNHVSAIIDFGFAGFGNKYFDIARILSRETPNNFSESIIKNYEKISGEKLDMNTLNTEIKIWKDIDSGYINYMRGIGIYE